MFKSKFIKILLVFLLLFSACMPLAYATNTNTAADTSNTTTVTTVSSVENDSMEFSDILNVLLIAIGVVIILLAIAILVKIRR